MREGDSLVENCRRLSRAASLLNVPISVTEQYPQGLGHTVAALAEFAADAIPKREFSSAPVLSWCQSVQPADSRFQVVIAGIEAHVCVQQTVFDLLAAGFSVNVVADAISSRHATDAKYAIKRMRDAGATLTTTEAVLFEWCETSTDPAFKEISRLVTGR